MKDEYVIINKTEILKRIEELYQLSIELGLPDSEFSIDLAQILSSQSTPLIPEIEKAFDEGRDSFFSSKSHNGSAEKQDYISTLKLDI